MNQTFRNKSKQPYNKPTLKIHGTVQEMTLGASSIPVGSDGQCPPGTAVTGNGDCKPFSSIILDLDDCLESI